ncbi:MAG: type V CRISPR-associated protein Cas12a/Cpf1 [Lachnospiraceae bacterium]|nr:type V CRISPR-associated protein Cas12a/Cpf1 [Lachnospiraceae bacterium]
MLLADSFMDRYPVSKTLRFELKPIGKTLEHIESDGLLDVDFKRAEDYKKVKKIIDQYHKVLIDEALAGIKLDGLNDYYDLYCKSVKDEYQKDQFEKIQSDLRKQIVATLKKHPNYAALFKKELIEDILPEFVNDIEDIKVIKEFKGFSTYFQGFYENRKNMYSDEAKSTSIAYRIIHQNLPKYIDNINVFRKVIEVDDLMDCNQLDERFEGKYSVKSVEDYFTLDGFNSVITQKGITEYNTVIGGFFNDKEEKVQGINELINLYNQQNKTKIPKMKPLFKQILSDRESASFTIDQFTSDDEVLLAIKAYKDELEQKIFDSKEDISPKKLFESIDRYSIDKIYVNNDVSLTAISQQLCGDWSVIKEAISDDYDKKAVLAKPKTKIVSEKYREKKQKELNKVAYYSLAELNFLFKTKGYDVSICDYYALRISEIFKKIDNSCDKLTDILDKEYKGNLKNDEQTVEYIKTYLDSLKELQSLIKQLVIKSNVGDIDFAFYAEIDRISEELFKLNTLYNKVRNYVTQKPYSTEKIKLNFNKATLLNGWDISKERDNLGVLLSKNEIHYLGIISTSDTSAMKNLPKAKTNDVYKKMNYKLLPSPSKMLPKVFLSKKGINKYQPSAELLSNYAKETHKKGENFSLEDCHSLIKFFKESIKKNDDWKVFGFEFSDTETYNDISGFYREVEQQGYSITYTDVDSDYINQLVDEGKLYLFQIHNKDFSPYAKGVPNLHTLYWKALFAEENLDNIVYKLNGEAEIFYRKHSIDSEDIVKHPANQPIRNKNLDATKKESIFEYDLIKDRRYTVDKFQFHVPITMNFCRSSSTNINADMNMHLKYADPEDINVIGIDRGERNLLYLVVVDCNGNIKEQISLNEIVSYNKRGESFSTDYHKLLDKKEKDRKAAREDWKTIGNIKEIKEGYLSQVIHVIVELMIKYNAVVVLEDLNFGFKRGRQKVEKQVYQKFEKMLIDKLNYYVDKRKAATENGGLYHAYQLTNKFDSFEKMGKQSGALFYIPAWMTSKIDPTTGFTNLFYVKYKSVEESKKFFDSFDNIIFNETEGYFEFYTDYEKFTNKVGDSRKDWTICSYGERIKRFRNPEKNNEWDARKVNLTNEFINIFNAFGIDYKSNNLKLMILDINESEFYKKMISLFSLVVQMRNSNSVTGEDYMISPVKNKAGHFFVSGENDSDPRDADANGAYHIARKGWWIIEKLQQTDDDKLLKLPVINQVEWLKYVQENPLNG